MIAACTTERVLQKPIEVKVAVPVPCRTPIVPVPVWPLDQIKQDVDIFTLVKTMISEIELRQAYEQKLKAASKACQ